MSQQTIDNDVAFEQVGSGLTVYESHEVVEGVTKWLETPEDVIAFVADDQDVSDVVVISRGGTTTFLTMALNAGVRGVVTLQGAPESHLGILCREYGIPAVMSVAFDKGVRTARGETIPADGVRIRLDVSARPTGVVSVELGAPVDDSPAPESAVPAMSEEQLAQIMLLLEKFGGEVPHGVEGDRIMQERQRTSVLRLDDDDFHRDLTRDEVNGAIEYYTWNEWDALAARATEGESGLIPRQEYEAMGIMNCWFQHPKWLRAIEDRVGIDGMIDIGSKAKREIGTKINMLHLWAMATASSFGRGIALELGLHDEAYRADAIRDAFGVARRLYKGFWGSGPMLSSMKGYQAQVLDADWVDRFERDRIELDDASRSAFQRFQGAAELMGFLLHFDNRLGVSDHGPYPTADGGFVIVRDIFLNEPAWHWNDPASPLPWSVTTAMFVGPDSGLQTQFVDISTVFTTPANYLPYVTGVAAYVRPTWDAPMSDVRALSIDDMVSLRPVIEEQSAALYGRIAAMSKREKIEAGALTYASGFALPFAREAGVVDELAADHDFWQLHPAVAASYDTIISGVASEMVPRLFLTGSWGHEVPENVTSDIASDAGEFAVLQALRVRGFATVEQIAASSGLGVDEIERVLTATDERGHTSRTGGRVRMHTLTPAGRARAVLLVDDRLSRADRERITSLYASFLFPNRDVKQLTTDAQGGADVHERLDAVHAQIRPLLGQLVELDERFARYDRRLDRAIEAFRQGDADALAKPLSDSYHDVWMELHEDLLATLGRERTETDE